MTRRFRLGVFTVGFLCSTTAFALAEIHRVDITLFSPCDNETAVKAAESLRAVPGVTNVDLVAGRLEVSVETGPEFSGDPLELAQKLWDGKIYPNKIYLQATGRIERRDDGFVFSADGTGQQFSVQDDATLRKLLSESEEGHVRQVTAEVVDWIEDRQPREGQLYTLKLLPDA